MAPTSQPLDGLRVIESAMLEVGSVGCLLAEMGAEVIKVEAPGGDYIRQMAWPIVEGVSLLHWHVNQGKSSVVLDLRTDPGRRAYLDLVANSHVVIEGMRPGALARRGLTWEALLEANPSLVFCSVSGYGATGPYADVPSHGVGFDAWAGAAPPDADDDGRPRIPGSLPVGSRATGPYAAAAILAAVLRARTVGTPARIDIAQADVAASLNWLDIEGHQAYERPEPEVTGNPSDGGERRPPGMAGLRDGIRYQYYASADGHVLFMASERKFWRNFCQAVGRDDLFDRHPGEQYADHARGNLALHEELTQIFASRTTAEWVTLADEANTTIVPVNDGNSIRHDPHFKARFTFDRPDDEGAELLSSPIHFVDEQRPVRHAAPRAGQDGERILRQVAGYSREQVREALGGGSEGP